MRELLSRPVIQAAPKLGVIAVGKLKLDLERRLFWRDNEPIHFSPKEFDLLALMMKNPDVPLTHVKLLRSVWGVEYGGELKYLRTYVHTLRKKIEKNASNPARIYRERALVRVSLPQPKRTGGPSTGVILPVVRSVQRIQPQARRTHDDSYYVDN